MIMSLPLSKIGNESLVTLTLPPRYGYCVLVAASSAAVLAWKASKVDRTRKHYNFPPTKIYGHTDDDFNCVPRVYHEILEDQAQFLSLLLVGGLDSPVWCACGGVVYLLGRIVYAHGYYSEKPKNGNLGLFSYVGLYMMWGATVKLALNLLQVI